MPQPDDRLKALVKELTSITDPKDPRVVLLLKELYTLQCQKEGVVERVEDHCPEK